MGPKLMNCCRPEPMGTQEYGKLLKMIQVLEDGRVPAKEANNWSIEGQKRRITRKEYQRLLNKFEMEGFTAQEGLWNLVREKVLRERGALPKEEGDVIGEYKAMHEEKFLSSWLREDGKKREEKKLEMGKENEEERSKKRRREEEKEENDTGTVARRCVGLFLWRLQIFSQRGDLESGGDLSWGDLLDKPNNLSDRESEVWGVVPDVTDVLVSNSCVVTDFCDGFSCCSDWEFVEPPSFSFSKKRAHYGTVTQEEMRNESSQVKAPPLSRRRMLPPTPLQNSYSSFEEEQEHFEVEDQIWSARDGFEGLRFWGVGKEKQQKQVQEGQWLSRSGPTWTGPNSDWTFVGRA